MKTVLAAVTPAIILSLASPALAEYPVIKATANYCRVEVRVSPDYLSGNCNQYPVAYTRSFSAGQTDERGEGWTMCVRVAASDCSTFGSDFRIVSTSKDLSQNQPRFMEF